MAGTQICIMTRLCGFTNFRILKISLKLDCGLLGWWLSGSGVIEVVVFLFLIEKAVCSPDLYCSLQTVILLLMSLPFCSQVHIQERKTKNQNLRNETKTVLHGDLRKHPKIVSHHRPPTFIINAWHSCSPMSQAPRIPDFHQAHLARDHPGYRLVNSSQWLSFPRDPRIIFWEW